MSQSDDPTSTPFRSVALFPWSFDSLATLWGGRLNTPENLLGWKDMISEFSGSIAAGQDGAMRVISLRMACKNSSVKLPHVCHFPPLRHPLIVMPNPSDRTQPVSKVLHGRYVRLTTWNRSLSFLDRVCFTSSMSKSAELLAIFAVMVA